MIKAALAVICNICGEVSGRARRPASCLGWLMRRMRELTSQALRVCTASKSRQYIFVLFAISCFLLVNLVSKSLMALIVELGGIFFFQLTVALSSLHFVCWALVLPQEMETMSKQQLAKWVSTAEQRSKQLCSVRVRVRLSSSFKPRPTEKKRIPFIAFHKNTHL